MNENKVELIDFNNKILQTIEFTIPNTAIQDIIDNKTRIINKQEIIELENISFTLYIPYNENAKELVISNKEKQLTKISLAQFSKSSKADNYISTLSTEQRNEITQKTEKPKLLEPESDTGWKILLWILILLLIIFVILFFRKKNKSH